MSGETKLFAEPKSVKVIVTLSLIVFLVFAGAVIYILVKKGEPPTTEEVRITEREKILQDVRAEASVSLHQAGWIDKEKGIVRIPIDRAVELTVQELKAKPVKAADVANPVPSLIVPPPQKP